MRDEQVARSGQLNALPVQFASWVEAAGLLAAAARPVAALGFFAHLFIDARGGGEVAIFAVLLRLRALADRLVVGRIGMLGAQGFDPGFLRGSGRRALCM